MKRGFDRGLDVGKHLSNTLSSEEISSINCLVEEVGTLKNYIVEDFNYAQILEIAKGLKDNVDVDVYAKKGFNEDQMQLIHLGLRSGVNAMLYANPRLSPIQMQVLEQGLEKGLNIDDINNPDCTVYEMLNYITGANKKKTKSVFCL